VIVGASIALATVLIEADSAVSEQWLAQWPTLSGVGAEGARLESVSKALNADLTLCAGEEKTD